ncbi:MAG: hypothetical protein MZV63_15280 [Marinilabiliales bacterium]|nr:hypothetical protein [Marinilabiliales bacterium]
MDVGMVQKELVTQKEIMVIPNPPPFLREGDEIAFTVKIVNLRIKRKKQDPFN